MRSTRYMGFGSRFRTDEYKTKLSAVGTDVVLVALLARNRLDAEEERRQRHILLKQIHPRHYRSGDRHTKSEHGRDRNLEASQSH
jgi:hypothetical protein